MVKIVKGVVKLIAGSGKLGKPIPQPTRDDAAAELMADDELRRRQGGAADIITGMRGAEAVPTAGRLVRGN